MPLAILAGDQELFELATFGHQTAVSVFEAQAYLMRTALGTAFGLLMSLNMLIETNGGFDYTGAECMQWMRDAGFRETRMEHLVGPDSMVVGIK